MRNPQTKDLVKQLSKELNISQEQLWDAVKTPFQFQVHCMKNIVRREEEYIPTIRVWGCGMFYCSAYNRKKLKEYLEWYKTRDKNDKSCSE